MSYFRKPRYKHLVETDKFTDFRDIPRSRKGRSWKDKKVKRQHFKHTGYTKYVNSDLLFINWMFHCAMTEDESFFHVGGLDEIEKQEVYSFKEKYNIPKEVKIIDTKLYKKYFDGWNER